MSSKFPRIFHFPWSPGATRDDRVLTCVDNFIGKEIIITEKMDGSNLCMMSNAIYARSHSGPPTHKSFDPAKSLHAQVKSRIDPGLHIFGEWCYAVHSIRYKYLPGYFLIFATRQVIVPQLEFGTMQLPAPFWWDWDVVRACAKHVQLPIVPELFRGVVETEAELKSWIDKLATHPSQFGAEREGLVVRVNENIEDQDFSKSFAKWVRKDHVQTDEHWLNKPIEKQGLLI